MTSNALSDPLSVAPGLHYPLGATVRDGGVNFAVISRPATAVDLCLYDEADPTREIARARLSRGEADVWHVFVRGLGPGALYGFRAHGPWLPANGMRFNSRKLLLDPYARAIVGRPDGRSEMLTLPGPNEFPGAADNGAAALKSAVVDDGFDWGDDAHPAIPWSETIIYELHVKGFTRLHPEVPEPLRGTYAGLALPAVIEHLKGLGVTTVQLLPVHQHLDDQFLLDRGVTNYWGYSTIGFFAPHNEYAAAREPRAQVAEFKAMVRAFHAAGLEVILDVVYNHTAEGDERGPSLMFRGLDNNGYYRHGFDGATMFYTNLTGCGNSVASHGSAGLRLILDSLRYWVTEMHVDGFRFDLAVTVARDREHFHALSPFFIAIAQDPVLSRVKLIAEPWDVGAHDSYQLGKFPEPWRELNGKYRDAARRFWRGDQGAAAEFAKRLCGSEDLYAAGHRPPLASVNLITSHDGYTLRDLVSHAAKHNEANGEDNRDGDHESFSTNCGHEGETRDAKINARRSRLRRGLFASMMCSLGVPFITAGDELGRTQRGNNNAYCQDNETSWLDWEAADTEMLEFVRQMIEFRKSRPALRRGIHFTGQRNPGTGRRDVTWLNCENGTLTHEQWHEPSRRLFGALLDGPEHFSASCGVCDGDRRMMLLLFNSGDAARDFHLPADDRHHGWRLVFDTGLTPAFPKGRGRVFKTSYSLAASTVVCLAPVEDD